MYLSRLNRDRKERIVSLCVSRFFANSTEMIVLGENSQNGSRLRRCVSSLTRRSKYSFAVAASVLSRKCCLRVTNSSTVKTYVAVRVDQTYTKTRWHGRQFSKRTQSPPMCFSAKGGDTNISLLPRSSLSPSYVSKCSTRVQSHAEIEFMCVSPYSSRICRASAMRGSKNRR
jgi:hypothetical protein